MKVFIDTDIFVRNLRYRDDKNIIDNYRFYTPAELLNSLRTEV